MGLRLIISILVGGIAGECMRRLSIKLINNRSEEVLQTPFLISRWSPIVWMLVGAAGCGIISILVAELVSSVGFMVFFMALICISTVDACIRKIPNELLVVLLVVKVVTIVINADYTGLGPSLIGFVAGCILFTIPSQIGIGIGWGDVKLAAVIGFCVGWIGMFEAVAVMAVAMGIYTLYLLTTHKGSLKTKVAMGPPLSLGMMIALLFPLEKMFS